MDSDHLSFDQGLEARVKNSLLRFVVASVFCASLSLITCSGSEDDTPHRVVDVHESNGDPDWVSPPNADVYVVGNGPVYWKNGKVHKLNGASYYTEGMSVFVSGDDVYVVGRHTPNYEHAVLWKNGQPLYLDGGSAYSKANSVFVSGENVYVAGYRSNPKGMDVATLWVNGKPQDLGNSVNPSNAHSVFVSGEDVYVGGVEDGYFGMIWKNGKSTGRITNPEYGGRYAKVYSVFVSGEDVHAAVSDFVGLPRANVWQYGEIQTLCLDAAVYSVAVSGGDVYAAGSEANREITETYVKFATLWKNGEKQSLTDGLRFAQASSVVAVGGNVYVAGYEEGENGKAVPMLWINGEAKPLKSAGISQARAVFVVERQPSGD